jgi:hypothetical protein
VDGRADGEYLAEPVAIDDDTNEQLVPADPKLYSTYDGAYGEPKPGDAAGSMAQGAENVVQKVKGRRHVATAQNRRTALRLARLKRLHRRALEHGAVDGEAGAVAGAVPGALGLVEAQEAAEVGASQRDRVEGTVLVAVDALLAPAVGHDACLAAGYAVYAQRSRRPKAVAHEVDGVLRAQPDQFVR